MDKEQKDLVATFTETFPGVVMVEHAMKLALRLHKQVDDASSEIERLRNELEQATKPKDIWHDCSHCQGHEPEAS